MIFSSKVPWKSSNSQDEKKSIQVPVQATMLSLYSFVFTIIMLNFINKYMTNNQFPLIIVAITLLFTSTQLPLILALTIKHSKKQKPKPNIPNKPMFYDDDSEAGRRLKVYKRQKRSRLGPPRQGILRAAAGLHV